MKPLLYNYYIDYSKKDKTRLIILCLLHELRVISIQQFILFFSNDCLSAESTIYKHLKLLKGDNLIERKGHGSTTYYYLTKEGHNYIGGSYTVPKVPDYNLEHHLQINDYLIHVLSLCKDHPHLKAVISERRKVFETKDGAKPKKGTVYFVPDFTLCFLDADGVEVEWQFEIELTLKTKARYRDGIFPKYIHQLARYEDAHLIYVTPSPIIKTELDVFKEYFEEEKGSSYAHVFDRLHVFSAEEFEENMQRLLVEDPFINW